MEFEYLTQAIEVVACQIRGEFLKKLIEENTNHFFENKWLNQWGKLGKTNWENSQDLGKTWDNSGKRNVLSSAGLPLNLENMENPSIFGEPGNSLFLFENSGTTQEKSVSQPFDSHICYNL